MPDQRRVTAGEIIAALAKRYPAPQFAFLPQVREGTGWSASRTVDALTMSLWPSRGLEVLGFEIKVHRGDWGRELKSPEKAEAVFGFCDRWWVVAVPGVVEPLEVPPTWGLMILEDDVLAVVKDAPKLEAKALDRVFVAAVLRRADALRADRKEVKQAVAKALKERRDAEQFELEQLKKAVATFEARAGVPFDTWMAEGIGLAVKFALNGGVVGIRRELARTRVTLAHLVKQIDGLGPLMIEEAARG